MQKRSKVIIVGGSSGIGFALASSLVEKGDEVIIASRSIDKLNAAYDKLQGKVETIPLDASDEASVKNLFKQVGPFDHLVSTIKPEHLVCGFQESNTKDVRSAFEAKFWGQYNLVRHCLASISAEGSIVLTSGIASLKSYKGFSGTAAINGAIESFVKSVATEIAPVRINSVCPGFIERFSSDSERYESVSKLGAKIPLQRLGAHEEVVAGYMYLLESTYSTGSNLVIDGGEIC